MHEVVTIETPGLGDRSYLIHDGGTAVVVDPQRDIDRVLQVAETSGVRISPCAGDAYPQRLRHRRAGAGPGHGRGLRGGRR